MFLIRIGLDFIVFFVQSVNLCLFIQLFYPFTFNVITGYKSTTLLFFPPFWSHLLFFSSLFPFGLNSFFNCYSVFSIIIVLVIHFYSFNDYPRYYQIYPFNAIYLKVIFVSFLEQCKNFVLLKYLTPLPHIHFWSFYCHIF